MLHSILDDILVKLLDDVFERLRKIDYNTAEGRKFGGIVICDTERVRAILDNNQGVTKNLKDRFVLLIGGAFSNGQLLTFGVNNAKDVINIITIGRK